MNRRGFLGGLLAVIAAPAVITTPGLLMPVSTLALPTYGPGGMLTPEMIAADFNRRLRSELPVKFAPISKVSGMPLYKQSGVNFEMPVQHLTLSLEEFGERYLAPAVGAIRLTVGNGRLAQGAQFVLMPNVDFQAIHDAGGVSSRILRNYNLWDDRVETRLDVLHS